MTPQRDLRGAEVATLFSSYSPEESTHEVEFEIEKVADLGGGKVATHPNRTMPREAEYHTIPAEPSIRPSGQ